MNDPREGGAPAPDDSKNELLPEAELAGLPAGMAAAVARAGWKDLMPVQARAMPYLLAGRDVMVQARTGSGKTGAFVLPILERLDASKPWCQALVLTPTRELARQVASEAAMLSGEGGPRVVAVYGGVGFGAQLEGFREGAHLVVGTPGRILDHLMRKSLDLGRLSILVFDEADRMLSIGFYPDMKEIKRYLPRDIDTFMFSATFPPQVLRLAEEFLRSPTFLSLSTGQVHVAEVEHAYYETPAMGKDRCLIRIIEVENPASAMIFCNTKANVHFVTEVLKQFGYDADEISSDVTQSRREEVMGRIRAGNLRFLVATDVAARGIDIPDLSHVIQYEPPEDPESYIHRAGRTGRAGAAGTALTLVNVIEKIELRRLAVRFGIDFRQRPLPTDEDVRAVAGERLLALLDASLRSRTVLERERLARYLPLAEELARDEDQRPLLALLLDDLYQRSLHAIPARPGGEARPEPSRPTGERREHRPSGDGERGQGRRRRRR